jgi:hypothetical protein
MKYVLALCIDLCAERKPGVVQAFEDGPIKARVQRHDRKPWTRRIRPARTEWPFTVIGRIIVIVAGVPDRLIGNNFGQEVRSERSEDLPITHKDFEGGSHVQPNYYHNSINR